MDPASVIGRVFCVKTRVWILSDAVDCFRIDVDTKNKTNYLSRLK